MDLSRYYEELCKHPIITKEEEFDLFMELQDEGLPESEKEKIRDKIIKSNMRFVFKQAKNYSKNDPDLFEELIAAGNEGLLVGLEKFKPSKNVRFLSYGGWWVVQRILKEMSKMRIVALPIWKQQLSARIQKATENREHELTFEELKKEFPEVNEKDLKELHQTRYLTYYLDDMSDDPSFEIDPIGSEVEIRLDRERIHAMINKLPSPHKEIIELSFGIVDGEEVTHANIAKQLGISKDQLREYKREGLEMLKEKLQGQ
jgi:RNA polymerase nonessential primary-like sigma factor